MIDSNLLRGLGLNIVPIPTKSKVLINWKQYQSEKCTLPTPENAAVICGDVSGGIAVIDIDEPSIVNKFFKDFNAIKNATLVTQTGSGGFHVYCKPRGKCPGILILNDDKHNHVGEIRGNGAYVIAPGSIHPNGNEYKIISNTTNIEEVDITNLLSSLKQFGIGTSNSLPIQDIIKGGLIKGSKNRNNSLYGLCKYLLIDRQLDEVTALDEVKRWNNTNLPPISEKEVMASFRSALQLAGRKQMEKIQDTPIEIPHLKMHQITPEYEGEKTTFNAVIVGIEEEKTYRKEASFKCFVCKEEKTVEANEDFELKTPYCTKDKIRYTINKKSLITDSIKTVILQEPMEEAIKGQQLVRYCKMVGDEARNVYYGQKKKITAIRKSIETSNKVESDVWFYVTDAEDLAKSIPQFPNEEEMKIILEAVKSPNFLETTLIPSFAPNIVGLQDVKLGMILSVVSGHKRGDDRTESHFIIVGDPSVAKSRLMDFGHRVTTGSTRAVGKGSTGVGLTYSVNTSKDKTTFISPGPVVMASDSVCYIDEFDKMNPDDRSLMHEIMEDRSCTVNKGKHHFTNNVFTTVVTMANPKHQKWDKLLNIQENLNLMPTLLSRFDQIWRVLDKNDSILDEQIATQIIKKKKGKIISIWNEELLTKYFNYVRKLEPQIDEEAEKKLIDFYVNTRNKTHERGIDPRGFEGLCRMATNRAKLLLKEIVDEEDIKNTLELYKKMLVSLGVDPDKDGFDTEKLFEKKSNAKSKVFFELWDKMKDEEGYIESKAFIEELAKTEQFDKRSAEKMFLDYEAVKYLRTSDGRYRLIEN